MHCLKDWFLFTLSLCTFTLMTTTCTFIFWYFIISWYRWNLSGLNNLQIVYNLLRVIMCKTLIMELAYVGSTTLNCVRMQTELLSIFKQHSYLEKKNENWQTNECTWSTLLFHRILLLWSLSGQCYPNIHGQLQWGCPCTQLQELGGQCNLIGFG